MDLLELLFAEPEDELSTVITELRWLTLRHPIAAKAAVRALIAEGRRFAATEDGKLWKERLERSELVRRGQLIWDVGTWSSLDDERAPLLPSELVDSFARAAARADLDRAIAQSVEPHVGDE